MSLTQKIKSGISLVANTALSAIIPAYGFCKGLSYSVQEKVVKSLIMGALAAFTATYSFYKVIYPGSEIYQNQKQRVAVHYYNHLIEKEDESTLTMATPIAPLLVISAVNKLPPGYRFIKNKETVELPADVVIFNKDKGWSIDTTKLYSKLEDKLKKELEKTKKEIRKIKENQPISIKKLEELETKIEQYQEEYNKEKEKLKTDLKNMVFPIIEEMNEKYEVLTKSDC